MTDVTVLQTRLQEVENAIHDLMTGQKEVSVKYEGTEVTYSKARLSDLRLYKAELEGKLGLRRRRSVRVTY